PSLLQLLERPARFNSLMLASVANQKYAVLGAKSGKKVPHLTGAGKTRFIHEVKMLRRAVVRLHGTDKKSLQCACIYSRLPKLFGRAGSRSEAFDGVALSFERAAKD